MDHQTINTMQELREDAFGALTRGEFHIAIEVWVPFVQV